MALDLLLSTSPRSIGIAIALCLGFIYYFIYDPYPRVPGPQFARVTSLWYLSKVWRGHFEEDNIHLHAKHGKIVRVGPKQYSIDDPEATKTIYGHGTKFSKSSWYTAWSPPSVAHINLFTMQDNQAHGAERRKLASMYSMSTLVSYEPYVDNCIAVLCQRLDGLAQSQESFSMSSWMQYFAFDVIGEITFAKRFGFMEKGDDVQGIIRGLDIAALQSTICGIYLILAPFVFTFFSGGIRQTVDFVNQNITERMQTLESPDKLSRPTPDFLSKIATLHKKDPDTYTDIHVFTACAQNIVAGSDTTSITLNSIFYHLCRHERVLSILRTEIDSAFMDDRLSSSMSFAQAQKLPYPQAVIKEALRMHPATGLPMWRDVPAGGAMISGQFFPAGASVGINAWVAHRSATVFRPDPNIFRPERWLESTASDLAAMERYYMPFGLGSRTCIGKNISMLEISKLVPQLVRKYDFNLQGSSWSTSNHWFVKQSKFDVVVSERKHG